MTVFAQTIELVFSRNGVWIDAYALGDDGERVTQLPLTGVVEEIAPSQPGITTLGLHSFRVKRTVQD